MLKGCRSFSLIQLQSYFLISSKWYIGRSYKHRTCFFSFFPQQKCSIICQNRIRYAFSTSKVQTKKKFCILSGGQTFWYEEELFLCCRRQLTIFSWPCPSKLTYIVHNSQSQGTQKLNCRLITRFYHHFTLRAFKALHWLALLFFLRDNLSDFFGSTLVSSKKLSDLHKKKDTGQFDQYNLTSGKNNKT